VVDRLSGPSGGWLAAWGEAWKCVCVFCDDSVRVMSITFSLHAVGRTVDTIPRFIATVHFAIYVRFVFVLRTIHMNAVCSGCLFIHLVSDYAWPAWPMAASQ
jgi:hypothetical protein